MKEKYPLPALLRKMNLPRSSYYYQLKALATIDKYEHLRCEVNQIFFENKARYGYRRVHAELKKVGMQVSEKVVRRVMKEGRLQVKIRKATKCSSYKGKSAPLFQTRCNGNSTVRSQINFFYRILASLRFLQARCICHRR